MTGNIFYPVTGLYQHHTPKALCVIVEGLETWFPLKCVRHAGTFHYKKGEEIKFETQEWLLKKNCQNHLVTNANG